MIVMKLVKTPIDDRKERKTLVNMAMESIPYYIHAIPKGTFSKSAGQYIGNGDDDPFFSRTKTHGRGVKSRERHQSHTEE